MPKYRPDRRFALVVRDFSVGLAVFSGLAVVSGAGTPSGATGEPHLFSSTAWAAGFQAPVLQAPAQPHLVTLAILGIVFAATVAFNLGFYRHLRRVYASPRAGAWRRGASPRG